MKRLSGMNQEELSQTLMEKISILKNNMAEWYEDQGIKEDKYLRTAEVLFFDELLFPRDLMYEHPDDIIYAIMMHTEFIQEVNFFLLGHYETISLNRFFVYGHKWLRVVCKTKKS